MKRAITLTALLCIALAAGQARGQSESERFRLTEDSRNVARPDFRLPLTGASLIDLGFASLEPLQIEENDDAYSRGPRTLLFHTPEPLMMREGCVVRFRLQMGDTDSVWVRAESDGSPMKFSFHIKEIYGDGSTTSLYNDVIPAGDEEFLRVGYYSQLEIDVVLLGDRFDIARPLWITVTPVGMGLGLEQTRFR